MSARAQRDIERLITRRLDGALSAEEGIELDRALLRDPELHRVFETSARIDAIAGEALGAAVGGADEPGFDPMALTATSVQARDDRRPRYRRMWWWLPGAVAAAMIAVAVLRPNVQPAPSGLAKLDGGAPVAVPPPVARNRPTPGTVRQASARSDTPRIRRDTARELFGMQGSDGRIYLFEVDHTWTVKRPTGQHRIRRVSGDF